MTTSPNRFGLFGLLFCAALLQPSPASAHSIQDDLQASIEKTLREHPELPSISVSVLSPRQDLNWTGVVGATAFDGEKLTQPPAFRIASVTKVFVAAATLRLIEQGAFRLDDPITGLVDPLTLEQLLGDGYDPERILVRHLLEHSSGIANYVSAEFAEKVLANPQHIWTRREQIELAMSKADPRNEPGAAFHYSDTGYVILGEIIERASDLPLSEAVKRLNQFSALNLEHTYFEALEPAPASLPVIAHQYLAGTDMSEHHPSFDLFGGGGLISTTPELARYFRALSLGWLFDQPQTLAMGLTAPDVARSSGENPHTPLMMVYSAGPHRCWGHGGFFGTVAVYCPDIDTAIAIAVNANTGGANSGLMQQLNDVARIVDEHADR